MSSRARCVLILCLFMVLSSRFPGLFGCARPGQVGAGRATRTVTQPEVVWSWSKVDNRQGPVVVCNALTTMHEQTLQFLILASVEGLGCRGAHRLLDHYKDPATLLRASAQELMQRGAPEVVAKMLLSEARKTQAEIELSKCLQNQIRILALSDPAYPKLLK